MKKITCLSVMLAVGLGLSPSIAQAESILQCKQYQKVAQMPVNPLTPAEQQFATQLSTLHKQIFSTVFTPQLRQEAMTLMTPQDPDMGGNGGISADMAVEEVISNHRDMPMTNQGMGSGSMGNDSSSSPTQSPTQSNRTQQSQKAKSPKYWNS